MKALIEQSIAESIAVKQKLVQQTELVARIARECVAVLRAGGKIVVFGNGGSAADAQHIAAELVGKFLQHRDALPAIALTTNTSILTAIANDISYDAVFARQVEALVTERDLAIGISTSGASPNVLEGIRAAKAKGARTVGLSGGDGGELARLADLALTVPSSSTPRIQESHITVGHILCDLIERELFG
jgi:D-sedoheptulose 7-phosphate isomerase